MRLFALLLGLLMTLSQSWNAHPDFALPTSEAIGETIEGECLSLAPWGAESWGLEAGVFNSTRRTLDAARIQQFGDALYLYGSHEGYATAPNAPHELGLVRVLQGNVWQGNGLCDTPISWHVPAPLPIADNALPLEVRYSLDTLAPLTARNSWIMIAVNIWLSSPHLPAGDDLNRQKPLVLDLVLYHHCNAPGCGLEHFEDEAGYHYQTLVTGNEPLRFAPMNWQADLRPIILAALDADYTCREEPCEGMPAALRENLDTLRLHQLEFVIELRNATAAALLHSLALYEG